MRYVIYMLDSRGEKLYFRFNKDLNQWRPVVNKKRAAKFETYSEAFEISTKIANSRYGRGEYIFVGEVE